MAAEATLPKVSAAGCAPAAAGDEVTAIDPAFERGSNVQPLSLIDVSGRFDAAVAVVS